MVVKRREDVLRVATVDAVAVPVEHVHVQKVRVRIDFAIRSQPATAADDPAAAGDFRVDPDFVRVSRALSERMAELERAHDGFEQILLAASERRQLRAQRRQQLAIDGAAFPHAEDIDAQAVPQKLLVTLHDPRLAAQMGHARVRRGKQVIVDTQSFVGRIEDSGPEIARTDQRHVAARAILPGLLRIIETAGAVTGDATQQKRRVVILSAQEVFVLRHVAGQADFVADGAELLSAHERLEERLLVEFRLRLDELLVEVLEECIGAVGKGIVNGLVDRVVAVADRAVDARDGVAGGARDARVRGRILFDVEIRIVKRSAQERHHVVTTGAPPRRLYAAIARQGHAAGFLNAEEVGLVVE